MDFENIIECKKKLYGVRIACKKYNSLSICNPNNIMDITNSTCIPPLLQSRTPTCTMVNNQHIPSVELLSPGLLLLNQYKGTANIDDEEVNLNGTYVIHFHNSSISIEGNTFTHSEETYLKPLPAVLQPSSQPTEIQEILSLEMIRELQINNTNHMSLIEDKSEFSVITNYSLSSIVVIIGIYMAVNSYLRRRAKSTKINITTTIKEKEDTSTGSEAGPASGTSNTPKPSRVNQIPYF